MVLNRFIKNSFLCLFEGCQEEMNVIFAVEGMNFNERYEEQLRFASHLISIHGHTSDLGMRARVGLVVYRDNARLAFQPGNHSDIKTLRKAILKVVNPFNDSSKVNFSHLLETAYLAFTISSDGRRPRSLVVFTYSRNVKASDKLLEYKNHLSNLNVVTTVVGLAQNLIRSDLAALTTDVNQILLRKTLMSPLALWIIDSICQGMCNMSS